MTKHLFREIDYAYDFGYIRCEHDILDCVKKSKNYDQLVTHLHKLIDMHHKKAQKEFIHEDDKRPLNNLKEDLKRKYVPTNKYTMENYEVEE